MASSNAVQRNGKNSYHLSRVCVVCSNIYWTALPCEAYGHSIPWLMVAVEVQVGFGYGYGIWVWVWVKVQVGFGYGFGIWIRIRIRIRIRNRVIMRLPRVLVCEHSCAPPP